MKQAYQQITKIGLVFFIIFVFGVLSNADDADRYISEARNYVAKGDFEKASIAWEQAKNLLDKTKEVGKYIDTVTHLGDAYQALGYHQKTLNLFYQTIPIVESGTDVYRKAQFFSKLADIYLSLGNLDKADQYLEKALTYARETNHPELVASVLTNAGNLLTADNDFDSALDAYSEALEWLEPLKDKSFLKSKIRLNILHAVGSIGEENDIREAVDNAYAAIAELPVSNDKASALIALSLIITEIRNYPELSETFRLDTHMIRMSLDVLDQAKQIALVLKNPRTASCAFGYLGRIYESDKKYVEAINFTRSAIFYAQQGSFQDILYVWQWQLGRLFKHIGDSARAIDLYKDAVQTLGPIRRELFRGLRIEKDIFNEQIKPVYLGLAELYLNVGKIKEARDTMELLKTAELQDFFKDECTTVMQSSMKTLEQTPPHTAVIYPIVLPESLAILLTLPDGIHYVSVPVNEKTLKDTVSLFRKQLQNRLNNRFLYQSEQLYQWLIGPIESALSKHNVDTLIIAPDGVLRLVPLAALSDGTHFLIEKYALAIIPAVTLTDPKPFRQDHLSILLSGLSEARQDFSPLPSVTAELADIKAIMGGQVIIMNNEFTAASLTEQFKTAEYTILHIATHGVFGGTPDESFLLTYDSKLTMDDLEKLIGLSRFRSNPVELLTLSACQTALGNERAALGLAGVAVKAGVKSAIATLWYVDDEATSLAIRDFYRQIKTPGMTKAKALQNVQKNLIAKPRYWQPLYWAPFVLIGNWM